MHVVAFQAQAQKAGSAISLFEFSGARLACWTSGASGFMAPTEEEEAERERREEGLNEEEEDDDGSQWKTGWADAITGLTEEQPATSFCAGEREGTGTGNGNAGGKVADEGGERERGTRFMLDELRKVGEVLLEVGSSSASESKHSWGPAGTLATEDELDAAVARLESVAQRLGNADAAVLRKRQADGGKHFLADVQVRRKAGNPLEVRIAVSPLAPPPPQKTKERRPRSQRIVPLSSQETLLAPRFDTLLTIVWSLD